MLKISKIFIFRHFLVHNFPIYQPFKTDFSKRFLRGRYQWSIKIDLRTKNLNLHCSYLLTQIFLFHPGIHPTTISDSFQKAAGKAVDILTKMAIPLDLNDRESLLKSANTSLNSKVGYVSGQISGAGRYVGYSANRPDIRQRPLSCFLAYYPFGFFH